MNKQSITFLFVALLATTVGTASTAFAQSSPLTDRARSRDTDRRLPPPGYHFEQRPRVGLIVGGATVTTMAYTGLLFASADDDDGFRAWLAVPLVGPFVQTAIEPSPATCEPSSYDAGASAGDGGALDGVGASLDLEGALLSSYACAGARSAYDLRMAAYMIDGVAQLAGAVMIATGLVHRSVLVPDSGSLQVRPTSLGGEGLGLVAQGDW